MFPIEHEKDDRGGYTHMLGQAAAMLVPFPAAIAAKVGHGAFSLALHQLSTLAGSAVPILELRVCLVRLIGRGLASDRRFLAGIVQALRQIPRSRADRTGFQSLATAETAAVEGHGERRSFSGVLERGRDRSGRIGGRRGDTLAASDAVMGIDGPQRYRVSVGSLVGTRKWTGKGQFLGWRRGQIISNATTQKKERARGGKKKGTDHRVRIRTLNDAMVRGIEIASGNRESESPLGRETPSIQGREDSGAGRQRGRLEGGSGWVVRLVVGSGRERSQVVCRQKERKGDETK
jgi:hypothetical protein